MCCLIMDLAEAIQQSVAVGLAGGGGGREGGIWWCDEEKKIKILLEPVNGREEH
jgi:hypothetical protein